jgi:hypothetical protein
MQVVTVFDIETGPLDEATVCRRVYLRAKNIEDIDERIAYVQKHTAQAALSAETGHVLAIGYGGSNGVKWVDGVDAERTEWDVLTSFWDKVEGAIRTGEKMVGFNIFEFDLPFLVCRSRYIQADVPHIALPNKYGKWHEIFIDIMVDWAVGRWKQRISMNLLADCLGLEGKNGNGAEFANLWATDQPRAKEYLLNDLRMTWETGRAIGSI